MEFIRPEGVSYRRSPLLPGWPCKRQPLAGDAAEQRQVLDARILRPEAEGAGGRNDRPGQAFAEKVDMQVDVCKFSPRSNTSCAGNTGPSWQTVLGPTFVWQVQPRQAPRPQAILRSRLARQGTPFSAQRR